jgi:hypothetical protein
MRAMQQMVASKWKQTDSTTTYCSCATPAAPCSPPAVVQYSSNDVYTHMSLQLPSVAQLLASPHTAGLWQFPYSHVPLPPPPPF